MDRAAEGERRFASRLSPKLQPGSVAPFRPEARFEARARGARRPSPRRRRGSGAAPCGEPRRRRAPRGAPTPRGPPPGAPLRRHGLRRRAAAPRLRGRGSASAHPPGRGRCLPSAAARASSLAKSGSPPRRSARRSAKDWGRRGRFPGALPAPRHHEASPGARQRDVEGAHLLGGALARPLRLEVVEAGRRGTEELVLLRLVAPAHPQRLAPPARLLLDAEQVDVVEVEPLGLVHGHDAHRVALRRARRALEGIRRPGGGVPQVARHAGRVGETLLEPRRELAEEALEVAEAMAAYEARRLARLRQHHAAQALDEAVRGLLLEGRAQLPRDRGAQRRGSPPSRRRARARECPRAPRAPPPGPRRPARRGAGRRCHGARPRGAGAPAPRAASTRRRARPPTASAARRRARGCRSGRRSRAPAPRRRCTSRRW